MLTIGRYERRLATWHAGPNSLCVWQSTWTRCRAQHLQKFHKLQKLQPTG